MDFGCASDILVGRIWVLLREFLEMSLLFIRDSGGVVVLVFDEFTFGEHTLGEQLAESDGRWLGLLHGWSARSCLLLRLLLLLLFLGSAV